MQYIYHQVSLKKDNISITMMHKPLVPFNSDAWPWTPSAEQAHTPQVRRSSEV